MPTKREYFILIPHLVLATCENVHQFMLWAVIMMVAGENGVCILGTRDLATLSMLSVGTVHQARLDLMRLGLIVGRLHRDHGYPNEVWHLSIPDLWAANRAWREQHHSLRGRIELKRAQRERTQRARSQRKRVQREQAGGPDVGPSPPEPTAPRS